MKCVPLSFCLVILVCYFPSETSIKASQSTSPHPKWRQWAAQQQYYCGRRGKCHVLGPAGTLRTDRQVKLLGFVQKRIQEWAKEKQKQVYLERYALHRQNADCLRKWKWPQGRGLSVFMGWVISHANKWEEYSYYFGERWGFSRNWATTRFLAFYGPSRNCPGVRGSDF